MDPIPLTVRDLVEVAFLFAVLVLIGGGTLGASRVHKRNQVWREMERRLEE